MVGVSEVADCCGVRIYQQIWTQTCLHHHPDCVCVCVCVCVWGGGGGEQRS